MTADTVAAPRLTRVGWLQLALRRLTDAGPEALRLDAICAAAGKTKGSFYHHFPDHDAFLLAVTDHWIEVQTDSLTDRFCNETMREADLRVLMQSVLELDMRLEAAIRHLAETHDGVAARVRETDMRRVAISADIYARRFGLDPDRARDLAKVDYGAFLGLSLIDPEMSDEEHLRMYDIFDDMILARYGPSRLE